MIVIIGLVILSISVLIPAMGFIVGLVVALGLSIRRGVFSRGMASRELQRELKKSLVETASIRADFERLSAELAGERAKIQVVEIPSPGAFI